MMSTEINPIPRRGGRLSRPLVNHNGLSRCPTAAIRSSGNDRVVPEICIGVREFECIGGSPPQDHPHVYINMGEADTLLCPYCGTRFRFNPRLTPLDADPPDSFVADQSAA
jgi:uncharacterized Zn-finger protein